MLEKVYKYSLSNAKTIERLISDENVDINHMILNRDEAIPEHKSNSNVYLIVVRGKMTAKFNEQEPTVYMAGNIVNVPFKTNMNLRNNESETLEFFVLKAPSPKSLM